MDLNFGIFACLALIICMVTLSIWDRFITNRYVVFNPRPGSLDDIMRNEMLLDAQYINLWTSKDDSVEWGTRYVECLYKYQCRFNDGCTSIGLFTNVTLSSNDNWNVQRCADIEYIFKASRPNSQSHNFRLNKFSHGRYVDVISNNSM